MKLNGIGSPRRLLGVPDTLWVSRPTGGGSERSFRSWPSGLRLPIATTLVPSLVAVVLLAVALLTISGWARPAPGVPTDEPTSLTSEEAPDPEVVVLATGQVSKETDSSGTSEVENPALEVTVEPPDALGSDAPPTLAPSAVSPAGSPAPAAAIQPVRSAAASSGVASAVPILMYHYVRVNPDPSDRIGYGLSVTPASFEQQMAFLAARGYRSVLVRDLAPGASWPVGEKVVAITFDDGYADAYLEAYPVLRRHGLQATFYVITSLVERGNYLSWSQVQALADGGMGVGSHTVTHPDLTRLGALGLNRELVDSRNELERRLRRPATDFCYPSGKQDAAARAAVGEAGYRTAVTTRPGVARQGDDRLALPRVRIYGGMTLADFAAALGESLDGSTGQQRVGR